MPDSSTLLRLISIIFNWSIVFIIQNLILLCMYFFSCTFRRLIYLTCNTTFYTFAPSSYRAIVNWTIIELFLLLHLLSTGKIFYIWCLRPQSWHFFALLFGLSDHKPIFLFIYLIFIKVSVHFFFFSFESIELLHINIYLH